MDEKAYDTATDKCVVAVDPRYFRAAEVETLLGDPTKAAKQLGWTPQVTFEELVREMSLHDLEAAQRDALVRQHGYKTNDFHE